MRTHRANLAILSLATAFNRTAPPLVVFSGGLVGFTLAPHPVWATLPVALVVVGMGAFAYPAAAIMSRIGRRAGFVGATLVAVAAALWAAQAIDAQSFWGFCGAMILIGGNQAFVQQYRFAAAENVPAHRVSYAVSLVLVSSLVSAYSGPELGQQGRDWIGGAPFAGSFLALAGVQLIAAVLLLGYREQRMAPHAAPEEARPLRAITAQPEYLVAAAAAGLSYAVMSLIMTAAPLSMHAGDGHSLDATAWAIELHIVAMYLPSLVMGTAIAWLGIYRSMYTGLAVMGACVAVACWGQTPLHYVAALILLGVGWNFLFTAGSTLITMTYRPAERFKAQGANDVLVFGTMAAVSLVAGVLLEYAGWRVLTLSTVPALVLMGVLVLIVSRRGDPHAVCAANRAALAPSGSDGGR